MPDRLSPEDPNSLRKELERYRLVVTELQTKIRELEDELQTTTAMTEMPTVVVTRPELHQTLIRLINKIAMIVQAGEVLVMLYQPELGELGVLPPMLGITDEQAGQLHIAPEQGITGLVYRTGESAIYNDAINDPRTLKDKVALLRVRNGICVPLTIKQRDEEERIIQERVIGVMHACNKRYEQAFNDDDVRLLEMLAEQAAAIISNAQIYIELTEEKARLEQTLETLHAGVIAVDGNGRIPRCSTGPPRRCWASRRCPTRASSSLPLSTMSRWPASYATRWPSRPRRKPRSSPRPTGASTRARPV